MAKPWERKGPYRETVVSIQSTHKLPLEFHSSDEVDLPRRWVVWATTNEDERVWIRTVNDDSDCLPLRLRSLLVKTFFEGLIGQEVEFDKYYGAGFESCYSVDGHEAVLPEHLLLDKFSLIYAWCEKNQPEWLENHLEQLRKKRNQAIVATKKKNAKEKEEVLKNLKKRREKALKLIFVEGRNPKWGDKQWQARLNGRLYVLARESQYDPAEGAIPVEEAMELVPGRVVLVERI